MVHKRDPREFVVGALVPGTKWVLRGVLGQGGMGVVLDVSKEPGIDGAMKVLLPAFAHQDSFTRRFFEEVKLLARVRHPNIVSVVDYDSLDDGTPFVVMERLTGHTLRAALRASGGPLPPRVVYDITRQLCDGLYCAHSHTPPIVHRDVKPENVYLHRPKLATPVVKLIDFGIAGVFGEASDKRTVGTPRYMAPEQILGDTTSQQTDLYTVAVVVYEMLTNRFPWPVDIRDMSAIINAHLRGIPAPPSRHASWIPRLVDECLLRALSKERKTRPRDAHEFVAGLYELQYAEDRPSIAPGVRASTAVTSPSHALAARDSVDSALTFLSATLHTYPGTNPGLQGASARPGGVGVLAPRRPPVRPRRGLPAADAPTVVQVDAPTVHGTLLPPAAQVAPPAADAASVGPQSPLEAIAAPPRPAWPQVGRVVWIALLVPAAGLLLFHSVPRSRSARPEDAQSQATSGLDGTAQGCDSSLEDRRSLRDAIRVVHGLPQRPTSSSEAAEAIAVKLNSTFRVRSSTYAGTREKGAPNSTSVAQPPGDPPELAPSTRLVQGARPSSDGFDELVLPRP